MALLRYFFYFLVTIVVAAIAVLLVLGGMDLWTGFHATREAARDLSCQSQLNQIQSALRTYEAANGHLPPAYVEGPDGTPWHSWRVLLLPYMYQKQLYEQYRFDEPWNGPNNRKLAETAEVKSWRCPSQPEEPTNKSTDYVVVVGEATAFPGAKSTCLADMTDGPENTILLVEIGNSDIHWMEPRDLEFDLLAWESDPRKASPNCISSLHPAGPAVVFADRITAYRLKPPMTLAELKALCTIAGGEGVTRDQVFSGGVGSAVAEQVDDEQE